MAAGDGPQLEGSASRNKRKESDNVSVELSDVSAIQKEGTRKQQEETDETQLSQRKRKELMQPAISGRRHQPK